MTREQRFVCFCILPILALIVAATVLFFAGYQTVAWFVANFGTFFYFIGLLVWIAVWDSRRKWPEVGWFTRMSYVLTFKR